LSAKLWNLVEICSQHLTSNGKSEEHLEQSTAAHTKRCGVAAQRLSFPNIPLGFKLLLKRSSIFALQKKNQSTTGTQQGLTQNYACTLPSTLSYKLSSDVVSLVVF